MTILDSQVIEIQKKKIEIEMLQNKIEELKSSQEAELVNLDKEYNLKKQELIDAQKIALSDLQEQLKVLQSELKTLMDSIK